MLVAEANDLTPYVDGMGVEVTRLVRRHPEFLRDPEALRRATGAARFVTGRDGQRKRIAGDNALIITTSGMLAGGPVPLYLPDSVESDEHGDADRVSVEGTPGRELQAGARPAGDKRDGASRQRSSGVVRLLSARRPRGLEAFLSPTRGSRVLVNHGDRCEARSRRTYAGTGSTRARPNWESGWSCRLRQTTASHARSTVSVGSRRSGIGSSILRVAIASPLGTGESACGRSAVGRAIGFKRKRIDGVRRTGGDRPPTLRRRCTPGRRARAPRSRSPQPASAGHPRRPRRPVCRRARIRHTPSAWSATRSKVGR